MYTKIVLIQTSYAEYGGGEFKTLSSFLFLYQTRNTFGFLATILRIHSLPHQNKIRFLNNYRSMLAFKNSTFLKIFPFQVHKYVF